MKINGKDMKCLIVFFLLIFPVLIFGQTAETEPNDDILQSGIKIITANGVFTGTTSPSFEDELWYIAAGSSGSITVTYDEAPDGAGTIFLGLYEGSSGYTEDKGDDVACAVEGETFNYTMQSDFYYIIKLKNFPIGAWQFTVSGDASLSIDLSSFFASVVDQGIQLVWITESETDNAGFIIDRSVQDDFSSGWQQIASYQNNNILKGAGNTSSQTKYRFVDMNLEHGITYNYRLSDVDLKGTVTIKDMLSILYDIQVPEKTVLEPAFPNPFNPVTKITYKLQEDTHVTLRIINITGRSVAYIIDNKFQNPGSYSYFWDGKDDNGKQQSSGIYFLLLNTGTDRKIQKLTLIK
ncbi:T9SS type A sorting domain-containing protein [bacterium]|nr:T9SS type A sorting domain-containing protein [bacterium]